ncbi:MAG: polyprenyl diphosphate synthase [Nanoarchaeota archaeon]
MASKVPKHIALVLDGNRRYAKKLGLQPWKGHEYGSKKLEELFRWCIELGIRELTLYCFSTENFKRAKKEVNYLFNLFWKQFNKMKSKQGVFNDKVRVKVIGRINMFSSRMRDAMQEAIEKTKKNKTLVVNFALAYGGRQEITDAVRKIAQEVERGRLKSTMVNEKLIANNLSLRNCPDIVIRPGGEVRTSNFLAWQSVYSEWFFIKKLWPEFTKKDLIMCLGEFHERERRFGR